MKPVLGTQVRCHGSARLAERDRARLASSRPKLAARALTSTSRGVAEIAADVGYESEAAFNRAFKRAFGSPPARYRRDQKLMRPAS